MKPYLRSLMVLFYLVWIAISLVVADERTRTHIPQPPKNVGTRTNLNAPGAPPVPQNAIETEIGPSPRPAEQDVDSIAECVAGDLIGIGGLAKVFAEKDPVRGTVAVKIPHMKFDPSLEREFNILEYLNKNAKSKIFPRVFEYQMSAEGDRLVMERLEGHDLKTMLEQKKLSPKQLHRIFKELAEGIAEMHDLGIIHRDIKPANIFITKDGSPKLIDFNIALDTRKQIPVKNKVKTESMPSSTGTPPPRGDTIPGKLVGTPAYMPPEVFTHVLYSAKGDSWSLGVTMYNSFTGRFPFDGLESVKPNPVKIREKIVNHELDIQLPPDIPQEYNEIIPGLLDPQPFSRTSSRTLFNRLSNIRY